VLPTVFRSVARLPELVLVGALAWCFALAGFADLLGLSREMGALVAGVALSTFPYTIDVVAKVTGIRDFFVTLFFVTLGMIFPRATAGDFGWAMAIASLLVVTRLATVFAPLYWLGAGHRGALLPALNLAQMSELSIVILSLGLKSGDVSESVLGRAGLAFAITAVVSTYAILQNDPILRVVSPWLTRLGLGDLKPGGGTEDATQRPTIFILGFSWTASSLLETIRRERPALLSDLRVVDFNPIVRRRLQQRGVSVVYGDVTQPEVLLHAGLSSARIIICSLSNSVLKGADNQSLLRRLRQLNPEAQIIINSEKLADLPGLYRDGAGYVTAPRLLEAAEIFDALEAAEKKLLPEKRQRQEAALLERDEVIP